MQEQSSSIRVRSTAASMRPSTCFQGLTSLLGKYAFTLGGRRNRLTASAYGMWQMFHEENRAIFQGGMKLPVPYGCARLNSARSRTRFAVCRDGPNLFQLQRSFRADHLFLVPRDVAARATNR